MSKRKLLSCQPSHSIEKVAQGPTGITSICWSPNAQYFYALDSEGQAFVYTPQENELILECNTSLKAPMVAWSPNSQYISTVRQDWQSKVIEIYDVTSKQRRVGYAIETKDKISALAWSPDSQYIAIGARDLSIYEALTGALICTYQLNLKQLRDLQIFDHQVNIDRVSSLAWSPDGESIAVSYRDSPFIILSVNYSPTPEELEQEQDQQIKAFLLFLLETLLTWNGKLNSPGLAWVLNGSGSQLSGEIHLSKLVLPKSDVAIRDPEFAKFFPDYNQRLKSKKETWNRIFHIFSRRWTTLKELREELETESARRLSVETREFFLAVFKQMESE